MEAATTEKPANKRRMSGAARRKRANRYKSGNVTNTAVKSVAADARVARFIKQVEKKKEQNPKDKLAVVPVAPAKLGKKAAKVQEAIKSQAFNIVRQKLVASLMQILPQTDAANGGNWDNGNNQGPMGSRGNNNNNNNNNNNMNNGGWGSNNNNNNNNMNMNNGGFWNNSNNNNNNNMNRGGANMQGGWNNNTNNNNLVRGVPNSQGGWNNNTNNNLDRGAMNTQGGWNINNNNRSAASSQGVWSNNNNNNNNNNNIGRGMPNTTGVWSSNSNNNLNFNALNNMPNSWSNNQQRAQPNMNNKNNNSNSVWDDPCPEAPAPPPWNNNPSAPTQRNNSGRMNLNQNQNTNLVGGVGNWNGSGNNQSNSMWSNKWGDDPRNAGGREFFQGQQNGGNDNYFNDQQNNDDYEYEQSSADLKFAIMDMNMPNGKIVGKRQELLKSAFNQALADVVLNSDRRFPPIQIKFSRFIQDTYKISVASRRCVDVLQNLVDRLPSLWPGSKLRLVPFQPRIKLQKASVFIRSGAIGRTTDEILLILERQNAGLTTDKWHVFHTKERDDGVLLIVGVDKQSLDYLERCEGRVFFLTSNAIFRLGKKPVGGANNGGNSGNPSPQSKPRNQKRK